MKLQKATLFALYAVLELAADPKRQMSAAEIADKYGISINHLAKVLRDLSRAGLVESVRGVGGGYRFSGNAKRVTLMDVIELFEDISSGGARKGEPGGATETGEVLHMVLAEIEDIARATLRSVTIDTLLKQTERRRRRQRLAEGGAVATAAAK
jgi:Rrf2 family protein